MRKGPRRLLRTILWHKAPCQAVGCPGTIAEPSSRHCRWAVREESVVVLQVAVVVLTECVSYPPRGAEHPPRRGAWSPRSCQCISHRRDLLLLFRLIRACGAHPGAFLFSIVRIPHHVTGIFTARISMLLHCCISWVHLLRHPSPAPFGGLVPPFRDEGLGSPDTAGGGPEPGGCDWIPKLCPHSLLILGVRLGSWEKEALRMTES